MAMKDNKKSSLMLYHDYLEKFEALTDEEFGRLIRAAMQYDRDGTSPKLEGNLRIMWPVIKATVDEDRKKRESARLSRSEAGKKGAAATWGDRENG